jgi:NAD(P)H-binding
MRIVVLGSTSRTGLCLLAEAQRRGHQIVAFTRRPHALPDSPPPATVVHSDGRDPATLRTALTGADAVISLLPGGNRHNPIVGDRPRLPIWILRRLLATPYADVSQMEQIISTSDLDWTIARLNRLTSKPATGAITTSTSLLTKPRPHTRADAASILLNLVETTTSVQTAINISGA